MSVCEGGISYVVVGVGVNVNTEHFSCEVADTAVSIQQATGKVWKKEEIISEIVKNFEGKVGGCRCRRNNGSFVPSTGEKLKSLCML